MQRAVRELHDPHSALGKLGEFSLKASPHGFQRSYLTSDACDFVGQERRSFISAEPACVIRLCQVSEYHHSVALRPCVLEML
jgi:hypothetical protein